MIKQDYILRMVEELAQAVARALQRKSQQEFESVEAEFERAEQALGIMRGAETLNARSLASLLGGDKCVLYVKILLARAALLEHQHSETHAWALRHRARELLGHSRPELLVDLKQELLRQAQ